MTTLRHDLTVPARGVDPILTVERCEGYEECAGDVVLVDLTPSNEVPTMVQAVEERAFPDAPGTRGTVLAYVPLAFGPVREVSP